MSFLFPPPVDEEDHKIYLTKCGIKNMLIGMIMRNNNVYSSLPEEMLDDDDLFLACCKSFNGTCNPLKYASKRIKDNAELVLDCVRLNDTFDNKQTSFKHASLRLRKCKDTAFKACLLNIRSIRHMRLKENDDREIQKEMFKKGFVEYTSFFYQFKYDIELVKCAISNRPECVKDLLPEHKDMEELMRLALKSTDTFHCNPDWQIADKHFKCQRIVENLSPRLKQNRNLILFALQNCGKYCWMFEYFDPIFKDDEEICKMAIVHNRDLFKYMSRRLRNNHDFVRFALKNGGKVPWKGRDGLWPNVSSRLREELELQILHVQTAKDTYQSLKAIYPTIPENISKELVLAAVKRHYDCLNWCSWGCMFAEKNPDVLEAIKKSKSATKIINWWKTLKNRSFKLAAYALLRLEREKEACKRDMNPKRLRDQIDDEENFWEMQEKMESYKMPLTDYISQIRKRKFN